MDATFQNAERIAINLLTRDLEFALVDDHLEPMFVLVYTNVPNLFIYQFPRVLIKRLI